MQPRRERARHCEQGLSHLAGGWRRRLQGQRRKLCGVVPGKDVPLSVSPHDASYPPRYESVSSQAIPRDLMVEG